MKKRSIVRLFIAVMIFLPIQYAVVGIVGEMHSEPWPAFVLPGFKNVYVSDDDLFQIEQKRFVIEIEGQPKVEILRPQELFPELPLSQVPGFMRTHFSGRSDVERLSEEARSFLYQQASNHLQTEPLMIELRIEIENYRFVDGVPILESVDQLDRIPITLKPEYSNEK